MEKIIVTREFDEMGRITIPYRFRQQLEIPKRGGFYIAVEDENVILIPIKEKDVFDGSTEELIEYKGKKVSKQSVQELVMLLNRNNDV